MPQMWNPPLCQKRSVWVILNATKRGGGPKPPPDFPLSSPPRQVFHPPVDGGINRGW